MKKTTHQNRSYKVIPVIAATDFCPAPQAPGYTLMCTWNAPQHLIKLWFGQIKLLLKFSWSDFLSDAVWSHTEYSPIDIYKLLAHRQRPRVKIQDGGLNTTKKREKRHWKHFQRRNSWYLTKKAQLSLVSLVWLLSKENRWELETSQELDCIAEVVVIRASS